MQPWGRLFLLSSQKLWCITWRNAALEICRQTIPLWLSHVYDTFTAVYKDEIDNVHDNLNEENADIQFCKEIEQNGKLSFLDCLASRDNNEVQTTVYRKPTHTDSWLHESSFNQTSHKATTKKDSDETRVTSLCHTGQLTWRKQIPWTCFSLKELQGWLYISNWQSKTLTGTLLRAFKPTGQTIFNDWLWRAGTLWGDRSFFHKNNSNADFIGRSGIQQGTGASFKF